MYLLGLALLLTLLKYLEIGPLANVSWWWIALPYALTAAWWTWADNMGYTKRKASERMDERKKARLEKQKEALRNTRLRR